MMMLPREDTKQFETGYELLRHYAEIRRKMLSRPEPLPTSPTYLIRATRPYDPRQYDEKPVKPQPAWGENATVGRMRYIVRATGVVRHISPADIANTHRDEFRVHARWLCWSIIKELTNKSLPEIGRALPGHQFDHTTVLYGIRCLDKFIEAGQGREPAEGVRPRVWELGRVLAKDRAEIRERAMNDIDRALARVPNRLVVK